MLRSQCAFEIGWAFINAYFIGNLNFNIFQNFKKFVFWKAWAHFDFKHSVSGINRQQRSCSTTCLLLPHKICSDQSNFKKKQIVFNMKDLYWAFFMHTCFVSINIGMVELPFSRVIDLYLFCWKILIGWPFMCD